MMAYESGVSYPWGGSALADPSSASSFFPTSSSSANTNSFAPFPSATNGAAAGSMDFGNQKRLRYTDTATSSFPNSYTVAAAAAAAAAANNSYAQFPYGDGQTQQANLAAQLPVNLSQYPSVLSGGAAGGGVAAAGAVNSLPFQLRPPSGQPLADNNFFSSALSSLYNQKVEQDARAFAAANGQRPPSSTTMSQSLLYPGLSGAQLHSAAASMMPTAAGLSMSMLQAGMDQSQLQGLFNGSHQLGNAGMMAGLSSLPSLPTTASSLSSGLFRHPSPMLNQLLPNPQLSSAGLLNPALLQSQAPLMHSQSHPGTQADMSHLTGMANSTVQSATNSAYGSPALSSSSGSSHPVSPLPLAPSSSVMETVTLSTLTCLIEKQYTIRKTESDRMPEVDKKQLIPVHVRILKERHRPTADSSSPALRGMVGIKREREDDLMLTPPSAGQPINGTGVSQSVPAASLYSEPYMSPAASPTLLPAQTDEHGSPSGFGSNSSAASSNSSLGSHASSSTRPPSPRLYIPATDIGPLLNIRKNNIPGYISKYDSSLRQQMMVDCPRAAGGVARVQLNVLTIAGAEKFIMTSRSKQAEKVWAWIHQHVSKIYKEQQTLLMQQHAAQQQQQQQQQQQAVREQQQQQQQPQQPLQVPPESQLPPPHPFAMVDRMSLAQQEAINAAVASGAVVPVTNVTLLKATNGVKLDPNGSPLSTASSSMLSGSPATYSLSASDISSISSPSSAALSTSTGSSPASSSSASSTSASRCSSPAHSLTHLPPSPSFRFVGMQPQYG